MKLTHLLFFIAFLPNLCSAEYRIFWVDIWNAGVRTQAEADAMLNAAVQAKSNAVFIGIRGEGHAYYLNRIEPLPQLGWKYQPGFDAISYITDKGHTLGLEVHAWFDVTPLWNPDRGYNPADPAHKWNMHGRHIKGSELWLTSTEHSNYMHGIVDLGHPDAARHTADVIVDPLRYYNLDGIHLDYIRYPYAVDRSNDGRWNPEFYGWNPTSIERFNRLNGRSGKPVQSDAAWQDWRRAQVTNFVRQVYLRAKEIRPSTKVSASVAVWGKPPAGENFQTTEPYQVGFQDWHAWMQEGIIDFVNPMLYRNDSDAASRSNFDAWLNWFADHKHDRQIVPGIGNYMNSISNTLAQAERVVAHPGKLAGFALFSYATTNNGGATNAAFYNTLGSRLSKAAIPSLNWITSPVTGSIAGEVSTASPTAADGLTVEVRRSTDSSLVKTTRTDGTGFFGSTGLAPGSYYVSLLRNGSQVARSGVKQVHAGAVTRIDAPITECAYSVSPSSVKMAAAGGVVKFSVTTSGSTCQWEAAASSIPGVSLTGAATRAGTAEVEYSFAANTGAAKSGSVSIAGISVSIAQDAGAADPASTAKCTYKLSLPVIWAPAAGGTVSLTVTASSPACQWKAGTGYSWGLALIGPSTRTGTSTLEYTFAPNTGPARAGFVNIANTSISMGQPAPATCMYTLSKPVIWMPAAGGTASLTVTASSPACQWKAGTGFSWGLALVGPSARTGTSTLQYTFAPNTGVARAGFVRIANTSISLGQLGAK
jgi:uncharacterized lipoprotein YddW (UPF0748 family)